MKMSENCVDINTDEPDEKSASANRQDDVAQQSCACAPPSLTDSKPNLADGEIPAKKRKTRRGKSKRRIYPYNNNKLNGGRSITTSIKTKSSNNKMIKPEAPYNSNQFLLEDHGNIEELDENLKNAEQISTTSGGRTRDSSFSVDSDGEFYSSPDDEEQFLIKDFVDQYESVQAERLQSMSKDELIQEYLLLESKLELLTKRLRKRGLNVAGEEFNDTSNGGNRLELQKEIERLTVENESLRREISVLKTRNTNNNKTCSSSSSSSSSDSEDSETDSDDSCSSTSSSSSCCSNKPTSPAIDYSQTNGHSTSIESV